MTQPYTIIITIVISVIATLTARFIWDRYMSKSSRVSVKDHERDMKCLKRRLDSGTQTFKEISVCLSTICMCQLELCEQMSMDCSKIKKLMVESGLGLKVG